MTHMVETSFDATRRLLEEALEFCEARECRFRVRTALQLLDAMEGELASVQADLDVFEQAVSSDPSLESALETLDIIEK